MVRATLTSKGQVTIPKEVRDRLGVGQGDEIDFIVGKEGSVVVRPVAGSARELFGCLRRTRGGLAPTVEEMNESVRRRAASEDRRIRGGDS